MLHLAGTQLAGKLIATCTGTFSPQAGAVVISASLTAATFTGCGAASTATASITPVCCTEAVAYARGGAAAQCFEHVDPSNNLCRRRPLVSRWGFYHQGELASGDLQAGVGGQCATAGSPVVGSVSARCRASDKALVFTATTSRGSSAPIRYWVGCDRPAAVAPSTGTGTGAATVSAGRRAGSRLTVGRRPLEAPSTACNMWRQLPAAGPVNTIELNTAMDGTSIVTSWVWKPSSAASVHCTCADVLWAVSAAGTLVDPTTETC